jgi:5'-methylthioadenosine phosphorylase
MLGVIGGTLLLGSDIIHELEEKVVSTKYGDVKCYVGDFVVLMRHGTNQEIPPHRVNHKANIWALKMMGVEKVVSINSTGSLKEEIKPNSILIPHDFVCFWDVPTFYEDRVHHALPEIDEEMRKRLIESANGIGNVYENGVYVQTKGPRLETKAEVRVLSTFGDVVGMTFASEATLCSEVGIPIASICSVDNYAHGIKGRITMDEIFKSAKTNQQKILSVLNKYITRYPEG